MPVGKKTYAQKYSKSWEDIPAFRSWLRPVEDNVYAAGCSVCGVNDLKAKRDNLLRHAKTYVHITMAKDYGKNADTKLEEVSK